MTTAPEEQTGTTCGQSMQPLDDEEQTPFVYIFIPFSTLATQELI